MPSSATSRSRTLAGDRALAEAVRRLQQARGEAPVVVVATSDAAPQAMPVEQRVIEWAKAQPCAAECREAAHDVARLYLAVRIVIALLALLGGGAAAAAALGAGHGQSVNIFWVIVSLIGLQSALLLGWLAAIAWPGPCGGAGAVGSAMSSSARRIAAWALRGREAHLAVLEAAARFAIEPNMARWRASAMSHRLWALFNIGCIVSLLILLSARSYTFHWETTILSAGAYDRLTAALATGPRWLGFATPTAELVAATQDRLAGEPSAVAQRAWSGFLLGSLVAYALIPRTALFILSLWQACRSLRQAALDLSHPRWAVLLAQLAPGSRSLGVIDPPDASAKPTPHAGKAPGRCARTAASPAIFGWELPSASPWPPAVRGVQWMDLGRADDRHGLQQAVAKLREREGEPASLVVVCSLTTTPDRGVESMLAQLGAANNHWQSLVLTGGDALRQRADAAGVARRVEDWRALASRCGIATDRTIEIDLEHMTEASSSRFRPLLGLGTETAAPQDRLGEAFALIAKAARSEPASLDDAASRELFKGIHGLYRPDHAPGWLSLRGDQWTPVRLSEQLSHGAARMARLLPGRLRADSRWLLAGALAGAMGCVAAAALVAPAAIAALPMWSTTGAAVAAVVRVSGIGVAHRVADSAGAERDMVAWRDHARAAALYAMLLQLQGRDEAAISRVLDEAAGDRQLDEPAQPSGVEAWLDGVRQRFHLALPAAARP